MLYTDIVKANEAVIDGLDAERYPELYRLFIRRKHSSSLYWHLFWMWEAMDEHSAPMALYKKSGYHTLSIGFMIKKHKGTPEAWQSHLIFLRDTGLLSAVKPTATTKQPDMKQAYQLATQEHRRPQTFYCIKELTDDILAEAERVAQIYRAHKISVSHITKTDVIRARGQEVADRLYQTPYTIAADEQTVTNEIIKIILRQIEENGYTTKAAIFTEAKSLQHRGIVRKLEARFSMLCQLAGVKYHPQRKEDRERFKTQTTAWIITRR